MAEAQAEGDRLKSALERLEKEKEDAEGEVATLRVKVEAVRAEMMTEMESALSDDEERLLQDLSSEVKRLHGQLADKIKNRTEVRPRHGQKLSDDTALTSFCLPLSSDCSSLRAKMPLRSSFSRASIASATASALK